MADERVLSIVLKFEQYLNKYGVYFLPGYFSNAIVDIITKYTDLFHQLSIEIENHDKLILLYSQINVNNIWHIIVYYAFVIYYLNADDDVMVFVDHTIVDFIDYSRNITISKHEYNEKIKAIENKNINNWHKVLL